MVRWVVVLLFFVGFFFLVQSIELGKGGQVSLFVLVLVLVLVLFLVLLPIEIPLTLLPPCFTRKCPLVSFVRAKIGRVRVRERRLCSRKGRFLGQDG